MLDETDLSELADATAVKLGLTKFAIIKDFYVTKAIKVMSSISNPYFKLIFQGGTSLSKGLQAIKRLSEDADFRIINKPTRILSN